MTLPDQPPESVLFAMRDSGNASYADIVAAYAVMRDYFNADKHPDPSYNSLKSSVRRLAVDVTNGLLEQQPMFNDQDMHNLTVAISRALAKAGAKSKAQTEMDHDMLEIVAHVLEAPGDLDAEFSAKLAKMLRVVAGRL